MLLRSIINTVAGSVLGTLILSAPALAGAKIELDNGRFITVGMGVRTSFSSIEDSAPDGGRSSDANLDSARLYFNAKLHENVSLEFNTECVFCSGSQRDYQVLDAVAKFEFSPGFNVWAGRMLVPADRAEMSGPYYANTYDFNKTPLYPADFSARFGAQGAGVYGRDHGVNVWGALGEERRLQYAVGVFNGLESSAGEGPNQGDDFLYAARVAYNFLNVEKNPGYYTSSTYYGAAGDILTVGVAAQVQNNGVGTADNPGDFKGMSVDLLMEKVLSNSGVVTLEAEYKRFDSDFDPAAYDDGGQCFCMFDGDAVTATALHLLPKKVGAGKFQPYVRYTRNSPDQSADRDELELGVNYVISEHNARVSLSYQKGDIATKGLDFSPGASGDKVDAFKIAFQLQF